ncbi:DUF1700 domain-containing protein [Anaerovorax odorimutans]|uniref:DUF1700 domain-containing protein n=1 Tax=Anaerovorax odorimutans TaxID=109327 RepID=UPI0003FFE848|nr:DUF1700 domain-containing protein [Anaerovorax odorimutans]
MNRDEFFRQLEQQLRRVPKEEAEDALEFYKQYFDEAGPENESKIIEELGSPVKIVTQLKAEVAIKELDKEKSPSVKKGISAIWWVILAIFAAPVALPVAITAILLIVVLIVAAVIIILSLGALVVSLFATGFIIVVLGIAVIVTSVPTGLFTMGVGLIALGLCLLFGIVVVLATKCIFRGLVKLMNKALKKRKGVK